MERLALKQPRPQMPMIAHRVNQPSPRELNPHNPDQIRFYALCRILGVSAQTIYTWRKGFANGFSNTPPLPVIVERYGGRNNVWVDRRELITWLGSFRPHLRVRLNQWERQCSLRPSVNLH